MINAVRTNNFKGHFLRSFIGCLSMFCSFAALFYLPLSDAVAIGYASPLVMVIFAAILLKEDVRIYRWIAVIVGLLGVLIMLWPHISSSAKDIGNDKSTYIGAVLALGGAVFSAAAGIQIRKLTRTERTAAIVFYFSCFSSVIALFTLPLGYFAGESYQWKIPDFNEFMLLVAVGISGGVAQILLTGSYARADASVIAPFEYTSMIWALLLDFFIFQMIPTITIITGGIIVAASGVFIIWRERQLGIIRKAEAESSARNPVTR